MGKYRILEQQGLNYLTLTIVGWIDIFSRQRYRDIVIESLKYCQEHKGLHINAYVIMSNHVHLNPVRAGIVAEPEHYLYSSAINYAGGIGLLEVELMELMGLIGPVM